MLMRNMRWERGFLRLGPKFLLLLLGVVGRLPLGLVVLGALLVALLVDHLEEAERSLLSGINGGLDVGSLDAGVTSSALGGNVTELAEQALDLLALAGVQLCLVLGKRLLSLGNKVLALVSLLNNLTTLLVRLGVTLGVGNHVLNLLVGKTGRRGDGHRLLAVSGLVDGADVDDTVGVNVERDLDLWETLGCGGKTNKLEVAEHLVVTGELTLSLEDLDLNGSLSVGGSGESLGLLGGNGGVTVDETGEDTAQSLDTERERGDVEKENVGDVTGKDTTLDGGTDGDGLVGVDTLAWLAAEDGLDSLDDLGHTGHTTDKENVVNLGSLDAGVIESLLAWVDSAVNQGLDESLELGTGEGEVDVFGSVGGGGDVRKRNIGREGGRKLALGLLGGLTNTLDSHAVRRDVDTRLLLELGKNVVDKGNVKVLTTKVSVTVGRLDLEDTLLHLKDGDIERSTTQVVDGDDSRIGLVETVCEGGGGRLVDDTEDLETSNRTGVLGGLTLRVVEVGRDGDDGVLDGLAEVGRGSVLHLVNDEGTDLGWRVVLATSLDPSVAVGVGDNLVGNVGDVFLDLGVLELAADQTLRGEDGVLVVDDCLPAGWLTNKTLTVWSEYEALAVWLEKN